MRIEHARVTKEFHLPSRAKQSFKDECDINNIMSKYMANGLIDHVNEHQGRYENLPDNVEFHDAMNQIRDAEEAFASLTSAIRRRFNNDPAQFLEFVLNEQNRDEIIALGLGVIPETPPASPPPDAGDAPEGDPPPA